ncbi:MAG: MaoC family dehydratase, partial [Jatrophihabitantaceae bacterium]
ADVTGDHQWIHVDVARAANGPFGATIAHGYLTLALIPLLTRSIYSFEQVKMGVNYGSNKVRFPSPVPVGSKVRAGASIIDVTEGPNGVQVVILVEVQGASYLRWGKGVSDSPG